MTDEKMIGRVREIFGDDGFSTSPSVLMGYTRDMWPRGTISRVTGDFGGAQPAMVVWPVTVNHVIDIVRLCRREKVPFVPVAAGSGVIGGANPVQGGVMIDMKRMNRLVSVDPVSMLATVEAGMNGMHLEEALNEKGYTLGHFPSSIMCSTAGGWAACRSAGQYSSKFGKIEDMIVSMEVVLPDGTVTEVDSFPAQRPPVDFSQLIIGSEGTLGIIVSLRLRVAATPVSRRFSGFKFARMEQGLDAMREIMQADVRPTMMRLYDPLDTLINSLSSKKKHAGSGGSAPPARGILAGLQGDIGHMVSGPMLGKVLEHPAMVFNLMDAMPLPSMLVMGFEGTESETRTALVRANELALAVGGTALGPEPGEAWYRKRYAVSWKLPKTFSQGAFAETIEVAGVWKDVAAIYHAVHSALKKRVAIMAHFSHAYEEGCAVYFTLAGKAPAGERSLALYDWAVQTALEKAMTAGATVSHHHGVGLMKSSFLGWEWKGGARAFGAIRDVVDPDRLLNPGKLFEAPDANKRQQESVSTQPPALGGREYTPDYPSEIPMILEEAAARRLKLTRQGPPVASQHDRVRLNLSRIDQILGLDQKSLTVTVQAGLPMTLLENYLQEKGLTLGFVPRHQMGLNVGEYVAMADGFNGSPKYGSIRTNCLAIEGYLADGTAFSSRAAPRRAAGPDLRYLLIGRGGVNGVVTSVTLKVFKVPQVREAVAYGTSDPVAAVSAVRTLIQRGIRPEWAMVVVRVPSDVGNRRPARLALQLGGDRQDVARSIETLSDVMAPLGLAPEPVTPDVRLHAAVELHEARELFMETGALMSLLGDLTSQELRRGSDSPEIHVTYFTPFGATMRFLLREPGQSLPAAFLGEYAARSNPVIERMGRRITEKLDPAGIFGDLEVTNG
ncbi:MAG TPA: FAD-binding oxidoreductase [Myxococcota bacterium]|nr:FAD-binding oxidoreductase [Myxococcota bacterium]